MSDHTKIPIQFDPSQQRMTGVAYHGNTPFDVPYVSHITGNLWTGGCTNGLILPPNIEHVISLYPWEQYTVRQELKSQLSVRMYDTAEGEPDLPLIRGIAAWADRCLNDGPTLIHCQAGLNRSNLIAAATLIHRGMDAQDAITLLRGKRSPAVLCNVAFEDFLFQL